MKGLNHTVNKKYGYKVCGKHYCGTSPTKKRVIRSDKKSRKRYLDKIFKDE